MDNKEKKDFSQSIRSEDDECQSFVTRRRGKLLEDSILEAALKELSDFGYNRLTIEGVAARAKTNKAVIYRRWAKKPALVLAALRKFIIPAYPKEVPNTGNLRDDVLVFLNGIAEPLQFIGAETMHGLMSEYLDMDLISSIPQIMHRVPEGKLTSTMISILKNAELRGEVELDKLSLRVISLPADLLRYELLTTQEPISDKTIAEIVDDIFMPLIHA